MALGMAQVPVHQLHRASMSHPLVLRLVAGSRHFLRCQVRPRSYDLQMTLHNGLLWQLRKGLPQESLNEAKAVFFSKYGSEPKAVYCSLSNQPIEGVLQERTIPLGTLWLPEHIVALDWKTQ